MEVFLLGGTAGSAAAMVWAVCSVSAAVGIVCTRGGARAIGHEAHLRSGTETGNQSARFGVAGVRVFPGRPWIMLTAACIRLW
jgi:hypothetical protein